jgi:branched-chain amino acid transport system permease protein
MRARRPLVILLLALLLALPFGAGRLYSEYYVALAIRIFIFALFLTGFDLLAGYAGLISFGHAMFFGTGAYVAALTLRYVTPSIGGVLAASIVVNGVVAAVVGFFAIRAREIYFVFLTFAFAQFFYNFVNTWEFVGAANGLPGIPKATLGFGIDLGHRTAFYYFTLAVAVGGYAVARRIVGSAYGRVLVGIRENEERARCLGYGVTACLRWAFVISGIYAGIAGSLLAADQSFVAPTLYYWSVSGEVLLMELLGGMGTLAGPVAGAAFVIVLGDTLSSLMAERWLLVMGLVYAACVLFSPTGFAGLARRLGVPRGAAPAPGGP